MTKEKPKMSTQYAKRSGAVDVAEKDKDEPNAEESIVPSNDMLKDVDLNEEDKKVETEPEDEGSKTIIKLREELKIRLDCNAYTASGETWFEPQTEIILSKGLEVVPVERVKINNSITVDVPFGDFKIRINLKESFLTRWKDGN